MDRNDIENDEEKNDPPFSWTSTTFMEEVKINIKMSFPMMITYIMQYILLLETMSFCGRLTTNEMDGVGLSLSVINALGWCIFDGMSTSCEIMFAQAFGSQYKKRTGLFLQRALIMMNLVPLFLCTIFINLEPLLVLFGQNPEISRFTGQFLVYFSPGLFFMMNYLIFARFLQDQGCLWPPVIAGLCGNIFNVLSQLLLISYFGYGIKISATCHMLSYGIMTLYEIVWILKTKFYKETWPGFQRESLYDWWDMFQFGFSATAQILFEVSVFEANVFMGGLLGPTQLAVQSILLQTIILMFSYHFSNEIKGPWTVLQK